MKTTTTRYSSQAIICAENIVLLSLLDETPTQPYANEPVHVDQTVRKQQVRRVLSFKREASLVRTLSFLSAVTGHANHVVATCIEELPVKGMRVMLAINKDRQNCSYKMMGQIKCGLDKIFNLLSRATAGDHSSLDEQLLDAIVEMCSERIKLRVGALRPHANEAPGIVLALTQALDAIKALHSKQDHTVEIESFVEQATNLLSLLKTPGAFTGTESSVQPHLKSIILAAFRLTESLDVPSILSHIPTQHLSSRTKDNITRRLERLSKYRTSSSHLLSSAKRHPCLFNNAQVVPVTLGAAHFSRPRIGPSPTSLQTSLSRCQQGVASPVGVEALATKLNVSLRTASPLFASTVNTVRKEAKIHAEVQIVAHYELHPTPLRPRVIASSKDACYLCNLFVATHGGFHVPRTHGRLYKAWRLPLGVAGLEGMQERMNAALEARIRKAVGERMAAAGKWAVAFPNESTAWTVAGSMETLGGVGTGEALSAAVVTVVSPREEEHPEPFQEEGTPTKPTGEQQHLLLPEPITDKDNPSQDPTSEPNPMSDISIERINSGAETLSPTASGPLINHSSPVRTTSQEDSPRTPLRKTPPPTPPPRDQSPAHSTSATSPQPPTPPLNHPLRLDIPGDPTPSTPPLQLTPTPSKEQETTPSPKGDNTNMSSPPPSQYLSPPTPQTTTTTTALTTTDAPESPRSTPAPPADPPKPRTRLLPLSQTKTTVHRLHPPPSPAVNYIYTTGTIDIYPSYTAKPHSSDDTDSYSPEPSKASANASPLLPPARGVVEMRIRWLPPAVAARVLRGRHGTSITYLDRLPEGGDDVDGGDPDRGYLVRGEDVVLVEVVRG
ncbi:hypothetical protein B0T18DRAFT_143637 [Schizothecium vesticola]|uniref:Uncharacterized protein n=1 Tax=Schizothecium vesticola TaxID=314040 RepID=A0AA40EVC8_9PEZI|nr:hypothetical protein B0T18DRAFT_143637 [Schizothecium vesticola]